MAAAGMALTLGRPWAVHDHFVIAEHGIVYLMSRPSLRVYHVITVLLRTCSHARCGPVARGAPPLLGT